MRANLYAPPAVAADLLRRSRLVDRLTHAVERPLTVISGPAGCGKTVLAAAWAAERSEPLRVVWVTLDESETDPQACWAAVAAGLAGEDDGPAPAYVGTDALRQLADGLAQGPVPTVLVLDTGDAHEGQPFAADLDAFLRMSGDGLRLVLLTRTLPALPLQRRRLEGTVTEIRGSDLAFSPAETRELVERSGLDLDDDELALLQARTCGWAAGLRFALAGLLARSDGRDALARFGGSSENVASFLLTEVLDVQPPHVRQFLLQTCVLGRLAPGAVAELTGDPHAGRVLDFLARGNVFLERVEGADNSRYQPLFREFLRTRLAHEDPDLARDLHRRAACWFAEHEAYPTAIRHALSAGDGALAATFLVESLGVWSLLVPGPRSASASIHRLLADDDPSPSAAVVRAAIAIRQQDAARALRELAGVRPDEPGTPALRFSCALLAALAEELADDVPVALGAVEQAEQELGEVSLRTLVAHPEVRVLLAMVTGRTRLRHGDFLGAARAFDEAVRLASSPDAPASVGECLGFAALAAAVSGRLRRARALAARSEAAAVAEASGGTPWAALALAWAACESGDRAQVGERLDEAAGAARQATDPVATAVRSLLRARLARAEGESDVALGILRATEELLTDGQREAWPGRVFVEELGDPAGTIAAMPDGAETSLAVALAVDLAVADAALGRGDESLAVSALADALALAAQEGLRRPFLESPEPVRALLTTRATLAERCRWLADEPDAHDREQKTHAPAVTLHGQVITPLTQREQEVLGLLAELLTTDEIAERLFVSVNTVRTHIRSVLCKLGANRRNEAVRRAWELGLLARGASQAAPAAGGMAG